MSRQGVKTGCPIQTCCVGGAKAVSDPPTDPSPKDGHRVQDGRRGVPESGPIQENGSKARTRQGETKVWWKAHPGGREAVNRG